MQLDSVDVGDASSPAEVLLKFLTVQAKLSDLVFAHSEGETCTVK